MIVEFQYDINSEVKIKAININGHIDALMYENNEKIYRVCYWYSGERYSTWMYSREIERGK